MSQKNLFENAQRMLKNLPALVDLSPQTVNLQLTQKVLDAVVRYASPEIAGLTLAGTREYIQVPNSANTEPIARFFGDVSCNAALEIMRRRNANAESIARVASREERFWVSYERLASLVSELDGMLQKRLASRLGDLRLDSFMLEHAGSSIQDAQAMVKGFAANNLLCYCCVGEPKQCWWGGGDEPEYCDDGHRVTMCPRADCP